MARDAVTSLISGTAETLGLDAVAGDVTEAVVDSLLGNAAVQNLISELALAIADGTPVDAIANTVIQAVINQPALQAAVGAAVGQAVGAIFGDNPIGFVVGQVVGAAATFVIGVAAGIANLFNLFGGVTPAASVGGSSYLIEQGRVLALLG